MYVSRMYVIDGMLKMDFLVTISRNCRVVHKNQHSLAMRIVGSTDFYREKNNENKAQKDVIEKPILTCHLHSIPT